MFGDDGDESPATSSFLGAKVVNWGEEPYIWGGYCYPLVGNEAGSNAAMAQSIDNVLFFAGEHTHTDAGATMQAAYDTGSRAAAEIAGTLISSREKERGAPPPLMQTGDEGGAS
jgi:monoamine oxidase